MIQLVTKLKYGNTNTFFIRGELGNILIDTDYAGTLPAFYKAIKAHGIKIGDMDYVLATHYHPDHIGLVSELMDQGVKLLILDTQISHVHFSEEIFSRDKRLNYKPISIHNATVISWDESRAFLKKLGINGEIFATPSHSDDSVSLILDSGECFVGDLEPIGYLDGYEENEKLKHDWEQIMLHSPKIIYYAHVNEKQM